MSYRTNRDNGGIFRPEGRESKAMDSSTANDSRLTLERILKNTKAKWRPVMHKCDKCGSWKAQGRIVLVPSSFDPDKKIRYALSKCQVCGHESGGYLA